VPFSLLFFLVYFPLLAIHILWINLVTDGLPGLALASEPAEGNVMRQPRDPTKHFAGKMALHIISVGLLMGSHSGHSVLGYSC
jgi:Ca2+-transporting ATPase